VAVPSGTVTFLFTDIEGSTRLWDAAPDAMRSALHRHDEIVRAAVESHGGYVFATGGDGFAVAFARAGDAVGSARDAQVGLAAEPWPDGLSLRVRMALHTGEAEERDGDYFGTAVNRTARLMALARGGQVLCSELTAGLARGAVELVDLGEHRLRDLSAPQRVFQVGSGRFLPLRSPDLVPSNLPVTLTELIGREADIDEVIGLVGHHRLVTLTGVGGVGKTRLALAVAAAAGSGFPDGAWLVELAAVGVAEDVPAAVASAMGAPLLAPVALARYLGERRSLVVLDNCEHVLDEAAALVEAALVAGPEPVVLATSREPLGVPGELVWRVRSLGVPDQDAGMADASESDAVRLFVERAATGGNRFVLDEANVAAVVGICRRLDGIPLAIELAAARAAGMPVVEIAARLGERFRLLSGGSRRAQERHRTLQAAVAWSHDLLSDDERVVFRRVSVFPASFELGAAEAVVADPSIDTVDCLVRLVERSMVSYEPAEGRYRLLETLRQFGADRLAEMDEADDTRDFHAQWCGMLAAESAPPLADTRYPSACRRLLAEIDNLRAAAAWLAEREDWAELFALCDATWMFWVAHAPAEWLAPYRQAIERSERLDEQVSLDGLGQLAWAAYQCGDYAQADELAESGIALADEAGLADSAWLWAARAQLALNKGDAAGGLRAAERTLRAAEANGSGDVATCLSLLAGALAQHGNSERARRVAEDAVAVAVLSPHPFYLGMTVVAAAWSCLPDFDACLAIMAQAADLYDQYHGGVTCWLYQFRGLARLGAGVPGAVADLVVAARLADKLVVPEALEIIVRLLALAAADAGLLEQALEFNGYADSQLADYRGAYQDWISRRLDTAMADVTADERSRYEASGATLTRRQLLELIHTVEVALSPETSLGAPTLSGP